MIFFGTKSKTVDGEQIEGRECPNCHTKIFFTFGIIRYFHLYWVPMFPVSKQAGMACVHCKNTLIGKELPGELQNKIKAAVFNTKNILSSYVGLFIIAGLLIFGTFSVYHAVGREAAYLEKPAVNDIYIVDYSQIFEKADPKYIYGIMRINKITGNAASFRLGKFVYNKITGTNDDIRTGKAVSDDYYKLKEVTFTFNQLKEMKSDGAINAIERK